MAGGNLSPRQKMINMMYLVLTALLALNVSKEVLNSFFEVNLGIVKTTKSIDKKNIDTYAGFENASNQEKVKNYKNLASSVKPISLSLVEGIQEMKYNLVLKADKQVFLGDYKDEEGDEIESNIFEVEYSELSSLEKSKKIAHLGAKDDRHAAGDVFNPENKSSLPNIDGIGKCTQLKNEIESFRQTLLGVLKVAEDSSWILKGSADFLADEINSSLKIEDGKVYGEKGKKVTWEYYNFYDMPSVGALTLLSKWQADIKNMESEVISFLAKNIDVSSLKFTSAEAITIPSSNFVLKGNDFQSNIFLTAKDETQTPQIYVGIYDSLGGGKYRFKGDSVKVDVTSGKGKFTVNTSSVGEKEYEGLIRLIADDGIKTYPFRGKYLVADKSVVVSPTYMNILYTLVDNPISVSVAGYQPEDLIVTISSSEGKISSDNERGGKKKGSYLVTIPKTKAGKLINISVSVKKSNGKTETIDKVEFRVKNVPKAVITHGKIKNGTTKVSKADLLNNLRFYALMENFEFKGVEKRVTEFRVTCMGTVKKVFEKRTTLDVDVQSEIKRLKTGDMVIIDQIFEIQLGGGGVPELNEKSFHYKIIN
jgi:gliding motility-associated protein GldM